MGCKGGSKGGQGGWKATKVSSFAGSCPTASYSVANNLRLITSKGDLKMAPASNIEAAIFCFVFLNEGPDILTTIWQKIQCSCCKSLFKSRSIQHDALKHFEHNKIFLGFSSYLHSHYQFVQSCICVTFFSQKHLLKGDSNPHPTVLTPDALPTELSSQCHHCCTVLMIK